MTPEFIIPCIVTSFTTQIGHNVILGWNSQTPLLLQTLAKGKKLQPQDPFFQRPVAVLADKPKAEMDAAITSVIGDLEVRETMCQEMRGLQALAVAPQVHTRKGSPQVAKDLKTISTEHAASVIIVAPDQ